MGDGPVCVAGGCQNAHVWRLGQLAPPLHIFGCRLPSDFLLPIRMLIPNDNEMNRQHKLKKTIPHIWGDCQKKAKLWENVTISSCLIDPWVFFSQKESVWGKLPLHTSLHCGTIHWDGRTCNSVSSICFHSNMVSSIMCWVQK